MRSEWIPWLTSNTVRSPWISGDAYVQELERRFAAANEVPFAVAVASGKAALQLALLALDIGPGEEIIVPAMSLVAAADMARLVLDARLVLADIDLHSCCLDPASVARVVTNRTRAIVAVDLYGNVAALDALKSLADGAGATLIGASAEIAFPRYNGRPTTSVVRISTHALQATHTDPMRDSGVAMTADESLHRRFRYLRDHGMLQRGPHRHSARHDFHLTNLQAAIGCAQLQKLDEIRAERARVHRCYDRCLQGLASFSQQGIPDTVTTAPWALAGRIVNTTNDRQSLENQRSEVIRLMKQRGIELRPCFHSLCSLAPEAEQHIPNALTVAAGALLLPAYPSLADRTVERICDTFRRSLREVLGE